MVRDLDPYAKRRVQAILRGLRSRTRDRFEVLSDGEDALRGVVGWFGKKCQHRLDWFHVARRIARIEKEFLYLPCPLAARKQISLAELRDETFITGAESEMPGYRLWITGLCSRLGKFRPSFVGQAESLPEALELGVTQHAVLLPSFVRQYTSVGVVTIPLAEAEATTDLHRVWQRGRTAGALRSILTTTTR